MQPFPEPVVSGANLNLYRRGEVRRYLAEMTHERFVEREDDEALMTTRQVREFLGGISSMWIWRRREKRGEHAA